eukprot:m.42403 g.42403  ORF g.42403 m.42403 type:complete len:176 (+) comp6269_c0_seq1:281-808(+)
MALRWVLRRAWVLPVGLTVWDLGVSVAQVQGRSMQPVLNPEYYPGAEPSTNWVLINRWSVVVTGSVRRGDIVTLIGPDNPSIRVVKRIIALEGDVIKTNGYIPHEYVKIPKGHCWIEGERAGHSHDSNTYGPVPLGLVTGRVAAVIWPPSEAGRVETYVPEDARNRQVHINTKKS